MRKKENKSDLDNKEDFSVLLKAYGLTTLYQRRIEHLYKSKIDEEFLNTERPKIELRSKTKVKFNQVFTDKAKVMNSPLYRGISLWNKLTSNVQKAKDIPTFKSMISLLIDSGQIVIS